VDAEEVILDALAKGRNVRFGSIAVLGYTGGLFEVDIGRAQPRLQVPADPMAAFVTIDGRPLREFARPDGWRGGPWTPKRSSSTRWPRGAR
jgi:hypothetical protein